MLVYTGYNIDIEHQPADVLQNMLLTFVLVPVVIWFFSLATMRFYPITREKSIELLTLLEERRGQL